MAFELPPLPSFSVNVPQMPNAIDQASKVAGLRAMLSENALRSQLAPLQVQEQEQKAKQAQIATELQTIQLQGQQGLTKWLTEGDTNDEVAPEKFALNDKIATFVGVDPKDPIMGVVRSMAQHGVPAPILMTEAQGMLQRRNEYNKGTEEQQKIIKDNYDTWKDAMGQLYNDKDPSHQSIMLADMLPRLQAATHLSPELNSMLQLLRQDPDKGIPVAYNLVAAQDKALGLSKAASEAATAAQKVIPAGGEMSPDTRQQIAKDVEVARETQPLKIATALAEGKARAIAQASLLTGDALDQSAQRYLESGVLPTGMRSPGMAAAIISRAAQLGGGQNIAANTAAYAANKSSYENVTKTLDTLTSFENAAVKNIDMFRKLAEKLPDTGVPWINQPLRTLDEKAVGAEWMPAINAAREIANREVARVTNDPKLSGVLSDSARSEVQSINPKDATFAQIMHVTDLMKQDMANVHSSLAMQKADIGSRLGMKSTAGNEKQNTVLPQSLTAAQVTAYAQAHNVSEDEVKRQAKAKGIKVPE